MMVRNPDGGAIAMLTTTRVVFSGSNQQLNRAFYSIALQDTGSRAAAPRGHCQGDQKRPASLQQQQQA